MMKNFIKSVICGAACVTLAACTANFEDINTSETATTSIEARFLFTKALVHGSAMSYSVSQYMFQTTTSAWAQHLSNIQPTFTGDRHEPGPEDGIWSFYYSNASFRPLFLNNLAKQQIQAQGGNPVQMAMVNIWDVYMFQRLTDMYGDIPYSEAFLSNMPKYDAQQDIYAAFVVVLDQSIAQLSDPANVVWPTFDTADVLYKGNKTQWIKFATSLKLRIALHQSKADPTGAQAIIATIDPAMVIQTNADNALMKTETAANAKTHYTKNTWGFVFTWNEVRISTNLMRYLDGTKYGVRDPRLLQFANPAEATATYEGLRNGIDNTDLQADQDGYKKNYSNLGPFYNTQDYEVPVMLLTAAEGNFMLAEAKLKWGLAGGSSAGDYYNAAVKASLDYYQPKWGGGQAYTDTDKNNYATTIAWNDAESNADKFARIMTQKWIALFTDGVEAFIEVRRTGIPAMDAIVSPYPGGNAAMPRRWMYSTAEAAYNGAAYSAAAARMGGDTQYTKVWIDGGN